MNIYYTQFNLVFLTTSLIKFLGVQNKTMMISKSLIDFFALWLLEIIFGKHSKLSMIRSETACIQACLYWPLSY